LQEGRSHHPAKSTLKREGACVWFDRTVGNESGSAPSGAAIYGIAVNQSAGAGGDWPIESDPIPPTDRRSGIDGPPQISLRRSRPRRSPT